MGIFDLFGASSKKIYSRDFRKALRKTSVLSTKERKYVEQAFKDRLSGGLSAYEIKKKCRELKHKPGDPLEASEVKKIKEKLLKYFE